MTVENVKFCIEQLKKSRFIRDKLHNYNVQSSSSHETIEENIQNSSLNNSFSQAGPKSNQRREVYSRQVSDSSSWAGIHITGALPNLGGGNVPKSGNVGDSVKSVPGKLLQSESNSLGLPSIELKRQQKSMIHGKLGANNSDMASSHSRGAKTSNHKSSGSQKSEKIFKINIMSSGSHDSNELHQQQQTNKSKSQVR